MKRKKSASVYFDQRRGDISQKEKLKGSWWAYHLYSLQTNIISKCLDLNFHIFSRFVSGIGQQIGGKSQSSEGRKQRKTRWVGSERTSLQPLLVFPVWAHFTDVSRCRLFLQIVLIKTRAKLIHNSYLDGLRRVKAIDSILTLRWVVQTS